MKWGLLPISIIFNITGSNYFICLDNFYVYYVLDYKLCHGIYTINYMQPVI